MCMREHVRVRVRAWHTQSCAERSFARRPSSVSVSLFLFQECFKAILDVLLLTQHSVPPTGTHTHARTHVRTHARKHARTHASKHASTHARLHMDVRCG